MNGITLTGASGTEYFYTFYKFAETRWHRDPGNYAFVYRDEAEEWRVAYVGETANLFQRMRGHGQWEAAKALGCEYVLVKLSAGGQRERRAEERDLIAKYQPPLNTQLLKPGKPKPPRNGYY
jgi:hypothetical protein